MRFSTQEDIETPIEYAFGQLSDFGAFERVVLRRGAEVTRIDTLSEPAPGMMWDARVTLRGRRRRIRTELSEFTPPGLMLFEAQSEGFDATFRVELLALSRRRTHVVVTLDLRPRSITARLLLQSARLAKNKLNRSYKKRVAGYLAEIEARFRRENGLT